MAKDKAEAKVEEVVITSVDDMPDIDKREWRYMRNGKVCVLKYTPLSLEQQEEVNAKHPIPTPPMKEIKDEKDALRRKALGMPTAEPDPEDPEYKEDLRVNDEQRRITTLYFALGWADSTEDFKKLLPKKLTVAEAYDLYGAVTRASFHIDPLRVEGFFPNLSQ